MFEAFECSGQVLLNSLCQFWNNKSIPFQIVSKFCPLYFFSSSNIYFAQKKPIKMKFFEIFECSGQILSNSFCQFWNKESIPLQILYLSSISWKITLLCFLAQAKYILLKRSRLTWNFLRLSSAHVKIHQISHVSFEITSQFLFKFCIILHYHDI